MNLCELVFVLLPWAVLFGIFWLFAALTRWAKQRRHGAIALGILVQMFLPDPNVQKTMETVAEAKQEQKKQQDENGDLLKRD